MKDILIYYISLYKNNTGLDYIPSWGRDTKMLKDCIGGEKEPKKVIDNFFKMWYDKKSDNNERTREFWALPDLKLFRFVINEVKAYKPVPKLCYYKEWR